MVKFLCLIQQRSSVYRKVLIIILLELTIVTNYCASNQANCSIRNRNTTFYSFPEIGNVAWERARQECMDQKLMLPVICNHDDNESLNKFLQAIRDISSVWTSGKKTNLTDWTWLNGQRFIGTIPSEHELFTHVVLDESRRYKATDPRNIIYYLCQYSEKGSSCSSPNATRVTNGCVIPGDRDRRWYDARNQCLSKDGDLAILSDDDLVTLNRSNKLSRAYSYWIGLRKDAWYWMQQDSESLSDADEVKYTNFPDDARLLQLHYDCISIDARNGKWTSVPCTDMKRVVCQTISAEATLSTIPTTSIQSPNPISIEPTNPCVTLIIVVVVVSLCLIVISNIIVALIVRKCIYRKVNASLNSAAAGIKQYQDLETTRRQLNPDGTYDELQLQPVYEEVSQRRK